MLFCSKIILHPKEEFPTLQRNNSKHPPSCRHHKWFPCSLLSLHRDWWHKIPNGQHWIVLLELNAQRSFQYDCSIDLKNKENQCKTVSMMFMNLKLYGFQVAKTASRQNQVTKQSRVKFKVYIMHMLVNWLSHGAHKVKEFQNCLMLRDSDSYNVCLISLPAGISTRYHDIWNLLLGFLPLPDLSTVSSWRLVMNDLEMTEILIHLLSHRYLKQRNKCTFFKL